jgi:hypothetical protein
MALNVEFPLRMINKVLRMEKSVAYEKLLLNMASAFMVFVNVAPRALGPVIQEFPFYKIIFVQIGRTSILICVSNHLDLKEICIASSSDCLSQIFVISNLSMFYKWEHKLLHRLYVENNTSHLIEDRSKVCLSSFR